MLPRRAEEAVVLIMSLQYCSITHRRLPVHFYAPAQDQVQNGLVYQHNFHRLVILEVLAQSHLERWPQLWRLRTSSPMAKTAAMII